MDPTVVPLPPTATFTFWGCNGGQGVHVRGLPALHHGFSHDLQVCVGLIVSGASVVPRGLAVLSLGENGLCSGGHVVLLWRRQWLLFGSGKLFGGQKRVRGRRRRFISGSQVLTQREFHYGSKAHTHSDGPELTTAAEILCRQEGSLSGGYVAPHLQWILLAQVVHLV